MVAYKHILVLSLGILCCNLGFAKSKHIERAGSQNMKVEDSSIKLASYSDEGNKASITPLKIKQKKKDSSSFHSAVKVGMGSVIGFNPMIEDGKAQLITVDYMAFLTRNLFIPIGFSYWQADINLGKLESGSSLEAATVKNLTVDTGIGYIGHITKRIEIPFGTRLGYEQMNLRVDYNGGKNESLDLYGKNITPFTGISYRPTANVSLGFESRLPIIVFNKDGSDDDSDDSSTSEEEKKSKSYPSYHMLSLKINL